MAIRGRPGIRADVVLPVSAFRADERLRALFGTCHRLAAATDDEPIRLVVGPARNPRRLSKHVQARLLHPRHVGSTAIYGLQWQPIGVGAAAYPSLDADLAITPIDETSSLLSIVGRYEPPFGTVGAALDAAALSRVASATVTSVLHRLARAVASAAHEPLEV